jgi:hypothetical protein
LRRSRVDLLEDFEDLIDFRITREERLASDHLGKNAANGPHIDTSRVLTSTKQNLRRTVPESDDLEQQIRPSQQTPDIKKYLMSIGPQRNAKSSSQSKIRQFQIALVVNQQVLRFQVAMKHTMAVAVSHTLEQLNHKLPDHLRTHSHGPKQLIGALGKLLSTSPLSSWNTLHVFLEIKVQEFKHEVQLVTIGVHDIEETNNVLIIHLFEQGDLANGGRGDTFIFGFEADFLESDNAVVLGGEVAGFVDDSVRA